MNVAQWLYVSGLTLADAPALFTGTEQRATYRQFANSACSLSACLVEDYKIKPGDRVAIYMANRIEYLIALYAVLWTGAVVVPINNKLHTKEALWIVENSGAKVVMTDSGSVFDKADLQSDCKEFGIDTEIYQSSVNSELAATKPKSVAPDTLAWIFYTSGTTGRPKGVMLSHQNLLAMSLCYSMDVDSICASDTSVYAAPLSHGAGLYSLIFVRAGARHVVPESRSFDSEEIFNIANNLRNLVMFAAPTMLKRLVACAKQSGQSGDGIKSIVLGGAPMYAADFIDALKVLGPRLIQIYGQGESPMTITALQRDVINDKNHPNWEARLASVGLAHSCVEVKVVDENANELPVNSCGEVIVRGTTVMQGYWQDPKATQETLRDGWLYTGDIGYLSEDGFLTLTDRSKDVIISGGSNIYPREVEEVLASHPAVFEVTVVGSPSEEWGEDVVAFVVSNLGQNTTVEELDAWCKIHIAPFKRPKRYIFRTELPKSSYGKVLKTELRRQLDA